MKVIELIEFLNALPSTIHDVEIQVNDNSGGEVYDIVCIDHFLKDRKNQLDEMVLIQVNC